MNTSPIVIIGILGTYVVTFGFGVFIGHRLGIYEAVKMLGKYFPKDK